MMKAGLIEQKYKTCQLEDLMARLDRFSREDRSKILTAYAFADHAHKGQKRASNDDYIIHPISVACILLDLKCDRDTVIAGILHDVVEDTTTTLEVIAEQFGETVAELVDGVTKFRSDTGINKEERIARNLQKTVASIIQDVRIVIIKLADRLHNMCTLEYKPSVTKAEETVQIFAPLAYLLGEYEMKCALEDLSFKYLYPDEYVALLALKGVYEQELQHIIDETLLSTFMLFNKNNLDVNMSLESKHLYGLRRRLLEINEHYTDEDIHRIHDYNALNIYVKRKEDMRKAYDVLKNSKSFECVPGKDRDYFTTPKSNRYMGLHSTIYIPGSEKGDMLQFQFKTREMAAINDHGITDYYKTSKKNVDKKKIQEIVSERQFYKELVDLQKENIPAQEYMDALKNDIFTKMIYIHNDKDPKHLVEMPNNSTVIDYAFRTNPDKACKIDRAFVNGEEVPLDYKLTSQDHVKVTYGNTPHPNDELIDNSYTYKTKRLVLKSNNK